MELTPPTAGLRRIRYDARSVAKVELRVQPGDTLEVPAGVAEQLLVASPQFRDVDAVPAARDEPAPATDAVDPAPASDADPAPAPVADADTAKPRGRKNAKG